MSKYLIPIISSFKKVFENLLLETEFVKKTLNILNCTPPWMTENEDLWCKGRMNFDSELSRSNYIKFVTDITLSEAETGKCLVPCKFTKYHTKEIGFRESLNNKTGMIIFFEKVVESTKTELQIGFKTLITRFGGIIGVSKNLLWITIFVVTSIGMMTSLLKQ